MAESWGAQPSFNFSDRDVWFPMHPFVTPTEFLFQFIHSVGMLSEPWYPPLSLDVALQPLQYDIHIAVRYALQHVHCQPLDPFLIPASGIFHAYIDGSGGSPATDEEPAADASWSFAIFSLDDSSNYIFHGASGGVVLDHEMYPLHVGAYECIPGTAELCALVWLHAWALQSPFVKKLIIPVSYTHLTLPTILLV